MDNNNQSQNDSDVALLSYLTQVWADLLPTYDTRYSNLFTDLFLRPMQVLSMSGHNILMSIDSEIKKKTIEKDYLPAIEKDFEEALGFPVTVAIEVQKKEEMPLTGVNVLRRNLSKYADADKDKDRDKDSNKEKDAQNGTPPDTPGALDTAPAFAGEPGTESAPIGSTLPPFNSAYTFDNYVVGNSNKFAQAAAYAVASHPAYERPAQAYNPLFICGPSGLGKTHLLYAITDKIRQSNQDVRVIYIKSEDFTNQMIDSLSRQAMKEFREKYRSCDVLLIDDIQFIAGKNSTQEEFFHTFNALYDDNKQIILTSDRPPQEIKLLEDRLVSRFEWGLIADIQPPDYELRTAIIKKKAQEAGITLDNDVLNYLADNLRSNVRQIEGTVNRLSAFSVLSGGVVDMDAARKCLHNLFGEKQSADVILDKIFTGVRSFYGVSKEDIIGSKRVKEIANARHISIYLARTMTDMSLQAIGDVFNRDHSTIMSSISIIGKKIDESNLFKSEIDRLKSEISK